MVKFYLVVWITINIKIILEGWLCIDSKRKPHLFVPLHH